MIAAAGASPATVAASMIRTLADAVALDEAGQHVLELIGRRILGVVAELLDAVGQAGVGEDGRDGLHAAVDPTGLDGGPDTVGVERLDERLETLTVVVVEGFDGSGQLVVGGRLERAVDQAERLHPVLHLVHAQRRYRASAAAYRRRPACRRSDPPVG